VTGELRAEVSPRTPAGFGSVEIFQGAGTIAERSAGKILLEYWAAVELADRVNKRCQDHAEAS
jgi:hypothetical protein